MRALGIQRALENHPLSLFLIDLERDLKVQCENISSLEEIRWLQNSFSTWVNDSDYNTEFYHSQALARCLT